MLKLVTISRISKEKGFERMLKMESLLSGVEFIWDCYGETSTNYARQIIPKFQKVNFKGVTNKPQEVLRQYDYLVQLSDTEGFPYSIYEALQIKKPVISTDFPSIHELIENGKNGYIFKMDLSDFILETILSIPKIKTFKEKSNEADWLKIL